jgi:hypothetical protein
MALIIICKTNSNTHKITQVDKKRLKPYIVLRVSTLYYVIISDFSSDVSGNETDIKVFMFWVRYHFTFHSTLGDDHVVIFYDAGCRFP